MIMVVIAVCETSYQCIDFRGYNIVYGGFLLSIILLGEIKGAVLDY